MEAEANKLLVQQYITTVMNRHNLTLLDQFVAFDIIDHNAGPDAPPGIEGYRQHLAAVWRTFPDFVLTIEHQFAEGPYVITHVTGRGTHQGEWLGITPRGTAVTVTGINIDRIVDGKIAEHWGEANTVGMLLQLGVRLVAPDAKVTE